MRDRLGGSGEVATVDVRARPALKLLWRDADRVTARVRRYDAAGIDVGAELAGTAGIDTVDVRIAQVDAGRAIVLHDLHLRKEAGRVRLTARLDSGRLATAPPAAAERLLALFVRARLSSDPRVEVERVAARPLGGGRFLLRADAQVR